MKKKSKTPNSRNGILNIKREDFKNIYEWQLKEHGDSKHKIVTTMPLKEYYALGLMCIDEQITISSFIRCAIRNQLANFKKAAKEIKKEEKKEHPNQGTLF